VVEPRLWATIDRCRALWTVGQHPNAPWSRRL